MPTITTENVAPLIARENVEGTTLTFVFACPASGAEVTAVHTLAPASGTSELQSKVKQTALSSLRGPLSSAIRSAFGRGTVGRIVGQIASKSASTAIKESAKGQKTPTVSQEQRDQAVIAAFTSIANQFEWDTDRASWVSSAACMEQKTGFQRQLGEAPIDSAYDEGVASRMWIEVACADGNLQDEEREILKLFLDPGLGSIDELATRPGLSRAELEEVSAGPVRKSMLATAWLVALANDGCDEHEAARLGTFCTAFGLSSDDSQAMRELAEEFLVDQMMARELANGDALQARTRVQELATTIEMNAERLERAEARFHKRRSMSAVRS